MSDEKEYGNGVVEPSEVLWSILPNSMTQPAWLIVIPLDHILHQHTVIERNGDHHGRRLTKSLILGRGLRC